jgi:hypothetical protein
VIFNKDRQSISRDGNAYRCGVITGSKETSAMTSQRWSTLVSVLVLALVLATAGSAQAQWGFPAASGYAGISDFGLGYGGPSNFVGFPFPGYGGPSNFVGFPFPGYGGPSNFVGFPHPVYGGPSNFIGFPLPGYTLSTGQTPQTTASFQSFSNVVTLVPSWNGSGHRTHRRYQTQPTVRRTGLRR